MLDNKTELSVSNEVLEKMAQIAACEIDGVSGLSKRAVDLKDAFRAKDPFKAIKVENVGGAVNVTVYLTVKNGVAVREVAEAVQKNVKEKIQSMAGTVVAKVNVKVADIDVSTNDEK